MGVKKFAIGSIASLLQVACVVAAAISITSKRNEDNSSNNNNDSKISTCTKSVHAICQQTDYKQTCIKSLAKANNTHDPKDLLKVAFSTAISVWTLLRTRLVSGVNRRLLNAHERMLHEVNSNGLKPNVIVAIDGSGQYESINEALRAVPKKNTQKFVIFIKADIYKEYIDIPRKMKHIVFIGEGPTKTKITGSKNFADGFGTFKTATVAINGDNFMAKDIGIENTAGAIKHQAVALRVSGDMAIFHNCQFDGYQDTLYVHTYRQFYRDCTLTGTIDFIFGDASSVFQNCKMIVRKPMANQACMVTAQGRKDRRGVGAIIMQNCEIRAENEFISLNQQSTRTWGDHGRSFRER
ncbi:hypothetical protein H5410_029171 [Solanum commersonii]|uniref:pectinesterase n=1 Tax=Solanum commersonii TaxID=4109 RepID=A0A9J5Z703_SOLCO|nr:hypothetical protein H5410_029171 [Solanum commersonii]